MANGWGRLEANAEELKTRSLGGETEPERPKNRVRIEDLHATIFTAMGVSPMRDARWRGKAITRLFA